MNILKNRKCFSLRWLISSTLIGFSVNDHSNNISEGSGDKINAK